MGMTSGSLILETTRAASGTFPPPGHVGSLKNFTSAQSDTIQTALYFGTGSGTVDTIIFQDKALAAGASATYDLYTGTDLPDLSSGTAAFRTIRRISISVASGGDSTGVRIGGAASNEWVGFFAAAGDKHDIFPDGPAYEGGSPAGSSVGSTTKNLLIENRGAEAVVVRIVIGGSIQVSGGFTGLFSGYMTYP
jgi:hypothetical protein